MILSGFLAKAASTVVTGVVGVTAYELVRKAMAKAPVHEAAVVTTAAALKGARKAEEGAEAARLKMADVVAEAKERIGEEVAPPAVAVEHDDEHEH